MHRQLRRRQAEDQPTVADVDVRQAEDVAQKSAICFGIGAVDDRVRSADHGASSRYGARVRTVRGCEGASEGAKVRRYGRRSMGALKPCISYCTLAPRTSDAPSHRRTLAPSHSSVQIPLEYAIDREIE